MSFKKYIIAFFIIPSLFFGISPYTVEANTYSEQERYQLLLRIQDLLNILISLQMQAKVQNQNFTSEKVPYESVYYNFPHKNIYFVVNGQLINSDGSGVVFTDHKELFDLFTAVVGESAAAGLVDEWRVFHNENSELGAYVELMSTTNNGPRNWVVGVNTEGYDNENQNSFINLFIHEYGHIVLYDLKTFEQNYKKSFWTVADEANSQSIKRARADNKLVITENYFEKNEDRFVNDYAVNDLIEDMAETFVYFVREDKPIGNTIRDQKIRSFYQESNLVKIRTQIRENLKTINL